MSVTVNEAGLRVDYVAGATPGTGTPDVPSDRVNGNNFMSKNTRALFYALGPGIYPWPDSNSFKVTAGTGLNPNINKGAGCVVVSSFSGVTGPLPQLLEANSTLSAINTAEGSSQLALPDNTTGWLFLQARVGTKDSRYDGGFSIYIGTSPTAAPGQTPHLEPQ